MLMKLVKIRVSLNRELGGLEGSRIGHQASSLAACLMKDKLIVAPRAMLLRREDRVIKDFSSLGILIFIFEDLRVEGLDEICG